MKNNNEPALPDHIKNIYYRGSLKSCNYGCSYCPFAKKKTSRQLLEKDKQSLNLFCNKAEQSAYVSRIMIIPYGEALIHSYYQDGMVRLAGFPHIEGISCQTNLSFDPEKFIERIRISGTDPSKIKLWASFHPEMTGIDEFLEKAHLLYQSRIELCVGVVGHPGHKDIISRLRESLDRGIYLFVNSMRGEGVQLLPKDISFFRGIDPFFEYDRKPVKADVKKCRGGKDTIFINDTGDIFACPRSGARIGHWNQPKTEGAACSKKTCDCYIAYSNISEKLKQAMGNGLLWRIPQKYPVKAIFFDIDGTLTDNDDHVPGSYATSLRYLSQNIPLFLATSLPEAFARRKLGELFRLFSGGIFADGGHIRHLEENHYRLIRQVPRIDRDVFRVTEHRNNEGGIFKYSITAKWSGDLLPLRDRLTPDYNIFVEDRLLTIVSSDASKKDGIIHLCSKLGLPLEDVAVIGNSEHDIPMLTICGYPCCVSGSDPSLLRHARFVINPDQLPIIFRS